MATGRLANVEGLNLKAVHIDADPARGIAVDEHLQTRAPNIWAIGDVIGQHQYTHAAEREAIGGLPERRAPTVEEVRRNATIPRSCFTDPEVASVGLTEAQAREVEPRLRVFRVEMADVDRPRIEAQAARPGEGHRHARR